MVQEIESGLEQLGWSKSACGKCGADFYRPGNQELCFSETCSGVQIAETNASPCITAADLKSEMESFLGNRGYTMSYPLGVVNRGSTWGNTSLIVSGVQRLIPFMANDAWVPRNIFINQPCVRTQHRGDECEWSCSSFVNPSLLTPNANWNSHFEAISNWLKSLEMFGIDIQKMSTTCRSVHEHWGDLFFTRHVLDFYYCGLHIGDAGYVPDLKRGAKVVSFSDIGCGSERIVGIVNGGKFCAAQTPADNQQPSCVSKFYDSIKALTLVLGSGATPSDRDAWQHVKRYICLIDQKIPNRDIEDAVGFYYRYWLDFVDQDRFMNNHQIITDLIVNNRHDKN